MPRGSCLEPTVVCHTKLLEDEARGTMDGRACRRLLPSGRTCNCNCLVSVRLSRVIRIVSVHVTLWRFPKFISSCNPPRLYLTRTSLPQDKRPSFAKLAVILGGRKHMPLGFAVRHGGRTDSGQTTTSAPQHLRLVLVITDIRKPAGRGSICLRWPGVDAVCVPAHSLCRLAQ
jgi:hypothetical protein